MSVGAADRDAVLATSGAARAGARPRRPGRPAAERAALGALVILAAGVRFWRISRQGYWFDEGNTVLLARFSPGQMLGLLPQSESTPPLYYCLTWVWARLFGFGEAGVRSLSALAGTALVPAAYLAGRRLLTPRAGLIAAALAATNPFLVWYSQEARAYSLLALLSALSLWLWAEARARPDRGRCLAWGLVASLALATHYYAVLLIAPQALDLLRRAQSRRAVVPGAALVTSTGLALLPLALAQNATGHASWIAPIPLAGRLEQIVPHFALGFAAPGYGVLEPLAAGLAGSAIVLGLLRGEGRERRGMLACAALAGSGLALNLALIAAGVDDLLTRNLIALWPAAGVCAAGGLGGRRAGLAGMAATVAICAVGIFACLGVAGTRSLQRPDWRVVARVLGARPSDGPRAILVQHYRDLLPLSLELPGLRFLGPAGARVRELDVISARAPRVHLCWYGAACNLSSSRMQERYALPGLIETWERRALQFTVMRLRARRPVLLTPAALSAVLRSTRLDQDGLLLQP